MKKYGVKLCVSCAYVAMKCHLVNAGATIAERCQMQIHTFIQ